MANYTATCRTNYFRVTNEERYNELFSMLSAEGEIYDFTKVDEDGCIWHGFGCYDTVFCYDEELDEYTDAFYVGLKDILPDDEAFILFEVGNENLRYVTGFATIVTHDHIEVVDLNHISKKKAGEMLGLDGCFETQTEY